MITADALLLVHLIGRVRVGVKGYRVRVRARVRVSVRVKD